MVSKVIHELNCKRDFAMDMYQETGEYKYLREVEFYDDEIKRIEGGKTMTQFRILSKEDTTGNVIYINNKGKELLFFLMTETENDWEKIDEIVKWGEKASIGDIFEDEKFVITLEEPEKPYKNLHTFYMGGCCVVVADVNDMDPDTNDYRKIALIYEGGVIKWKVDELAEEDKKKIEEIAKGLPLENARAKVNKM